MPWSIVEDHPECDEPFAVIKDDDESLTGCHSSRESAEEQIQALHAAEADMSNQLNLIYVELEELTPGKPFDALLAGEFVDMRGREVTIDDDDLDVIVANTRERIQHNQTELGLEGLPVDATNHDKGDAAAWITDVLLEDGRIRVVPKWTELGVEKVSKKIQQLFSATIDLANKVIVGGTLTNWPAVKGLRAIELSEGTYTTAPEEPSWLGRLAERVASLITPAEQIVEASEGNEDEEPTDEDEQEVLEVELTEEQLNEMVAEQVREGVGVALRDLVEQNRSEPTENGDDGDGTNGDLDLVALLGLEGEEDKVIEASKEKLREHHEAIQKRAIQEYAQMTAQLQRESRMTELASKVTGGTEEFPRGLRVDPDKLSEALLALPKNQETFWVNLLERTQENGLAEFEELGHSRRVQGTKELPQDIQDDLDAGELTLRDLRSDVMRPVLGDLDQYDLSQWKEN